MKPTRNNSCQSTRMTIDSQVDRQIAEGGSKMANASSSNSTTSTRPSIISRSPHNHHSISAGQYPNPEIDEYQYPSFHYSQATSKRGPGQSLSSATCSNSHHYVLENGERHFAASCSNTFNNQGKCESSFRRIDQDQEQEHYFPRSHDYLKPNYSLGNPYDSLHSSFRSNPSPTNHTVVTNLDTSSLQSSAGGSVVDHTYRDFSGVPPSNEDMERYTNKKTEYGRRLKQNKEKAASESSSNNDLPGANAKRPTVKKRGRGNKMSKGGSETFIGFMGTNFPARLHDLLAHENDINDIIEWLPHGRSWIVRDKVQFLRKVAPSHFQISKFESFTRQVNGWGFKRITQGPDINSYYHELFLKGMPHLIQWMKRAPSSGGNGKRRPRVDPKDEPNFYKIGLMYPIQDYYSENGSFPVSVSNNTQRQEVCSGRDEGRESSHIIPRKDSSFVTEDIYGVLEDHHSYPWKYQQQNIRQDDVYYPSSPKKKRSDNHKQTFINVDQEISADDFWRLPTTNRQDHKDDHHFSDGHCHTYHHESATTSSSRYCTEESSQDYGGDYVAASKNHWQTFCDALSQPEHNENQAFSGQDNTVQFNNCDFSADLEPHSIYDGTPAFAFGQHASNGNHHSEYPYNQHPAHDDLNNLHYE